jgi:hypothetical protein
VWVGCLRLASEPLPSWPGLTRPSTPRRLRRRPRQRRIVARPSEATVCDQRRPPMRRNAWMAGQARPGRFGPVSAATTRGNLSPTANAIRAKSRLVLELAPSSDRVRGRGPGVGPARSQRSRSRAAPSATRTRTAAPQVRWLGGLGLGRVATRARAQRRGRTWQSDAGLGGSAADSAPSASRGS